MQTTILKKDFINALKIGGAMAGKSKNLPILECAKIDITNDSMVVHSFNEETWVTKRTLIESTDAEYSFCINPSELVKAIKSLADEVITFSLEGNLFVINHFKGVMEMPIVSSGHFPEAKTMNDGVSVVLDPALMKKWLVTANDFVGNDDLRPVMNGMYFYHQNGKLGVCATDAHKLWHEYIECSDTLEDFGVTIPNGCFKSLLNILDGDKTKAIVGESNISFVSQDSELYCRLIEGRFPDFQRVIPTQFSIETNVSKSELADSVSRVCIFANKSTSMLKISVGDTTMKLEGVDSDFSRKASESIKAENSGENITIGVKGDFLSTLLSHITSSDVLLKMNKPNLPIILHDINEPNKSILVMPMMIQ